jgi:diadenosine tetraphosphate (Ap4A) HIT family hydrolase
MLKWVDYSDAALLYSQTVIAMVRLCRLVKQVTTTMPDSTTKPGSQTAIHGLVEQCRAGTLPRMVARVRSGWVVVGEPQILPGYCQLLPDPVVSDLHDLSHIDRLQFLDDLGQLGEAVAGVTRARRINYEMLGNLEPALHAHVIPRYDSEPERLRTKPVWLHDWDRARSFDLARDREFIERLRAKLQELGVVVSAETEMGIGEDAAQLREIHEVRQIAGEPRRRWFTSRDMDLVVWLTDTDDICGFQICSDEPGGPYALTWDRGRGSFHARVDDGENVPGRHKATPILIPTSDIDRSALLRRFRAANRDVDARIRDFVLDTLTAGKET